MALPATAKQRRLLQELLDEIGAPVEVRPDLSALTTREAAELLRELVAVTRGPRRRSWVVRWFAGAAMWLQLAFVLLFLVLLVIETVRSTVSLFDDGASNAPARPVERGPHTPGSPPDFDSMFGDGVIDAPPEAPPSNPDHPR